MSKLNLKDYEMDAYKEVEKDLKNKISRLETDLKAVAQADITAKDLCHVDYNGVEYYSYEEIQEAYGYGCMTQRRMEMLQDELMEKRKQAGLSYRMHKLETKLNCYRKLHTQVFNTIHWDEED
jgi:hypothetical protein